MGKRNLKETSEEDTRESSSPKKKHKHKHKKHKKKKDYGAEGHEEDRKKEKSKDRSKSREKDKGKDATKDEDVATSMGRAVKLKIKLGGQTMATTQMAKIVPVSAPEPAVTSGEEEEEDYQPSWQGSEKDDREPADQHGDSDEQEEQKWLDALEKGELDDYGRVKQDKDVSMMTARQRAMLGHEIEGENQLLELPTEPRRKNEDSEEAQKRRKQRARKRKQQMQKKIEENKAQTVKKLLDRDGARSRKEEEKARRKKQDVPHIRYISNQCGFALSLSEGVEFPMKAQSGKGPPKTTPTCSAAGCKNLKRYSCSSNNMPVCSMECYKVVKHLPPTAAVT